MGVGYNGTPNEYDYGKFDYTLWTAGSEITLCNVPWDGTYLSTVEFENGQAGLDAYIDSIPHLTFTAMVQMYPFEDLRLEMTHSDASMFNYVRVKNSEQPVQGGKPVKTYYYFINEIRSLAPETQALSVQVDMWQTYIYNVTFGNCYIERGHIGIANENQFDSFGRRYLTVPEGIDTGAEYQTIATRREVVMGTDYIVNPDGSFTTEENTNIVVISSTDLTADPGTVTDPKLITATGGVVQNIGSGGTYYLFENISSFRNFLNNYQEMPWVTQGIMAAYMVPKVERYVSIPPAFPATGIPLEWNFESPVPLKHFLQNDWRNNSEWVDKIPAKYRHLRKFWTFPYMAIEMTTWTGTPIILKPEIWNNPNAEVLERISYVAPGQRMEFHAQSYNSPDGVPVDNWQGLSDATLELIAPEYRERYRRVGDDHGDYWDHATMIANLPSMAIVNNAAIGYLASNMNSLAYQRESAGWTQERAMEGNRNAYDNTARGLDLQRTLNQMGINADQLQVANENRTQAAQAVVGAAGTLASGIGSGSATGLLGSALAAGGAAINTGISIAARDEAMSIRNTNSRAQTAESINTNRGIANNNKNLADWAARGDYHNTIAGINAKVNDSKLLQPHTSGQVGGETINLANNMVQVSCRWKLVDEANLERIGDYWLRYGYAINQFAKLDRLQVMENFTYWKLTETYITSGPMPEPFKNGIRGIMEKGVTVYRHPSLIGTVDISDNAPLEGITL